METDVVRFVRLKKGINVRVSLHDVPIIVGMESSILERLVTMRNKEDAIQIVLGIILDGFAMVLNLLTAILFAKMGLMTQVRFTLSSVMISTIKIMMDVQRDVWSNQDGHVKLLMFVQRFVKMAEL